MKKLQLKTIKCKLKDILRKDVNYDDLFNMLERMNDITSLCYMFLRAYLIHLYEAKKAFPIIDRQFICLVYKTLSNTNGGRPSTNTEEQDKLNEFYTSFAKELNIIEKFDASNLSFVYGSESEMIYNSIINNIKYHFSNYISKFVRVLFTIHNKTQLETLKNDKLKEFKKQLYLDNTAVINDILNNTTEASTELHNLIKEHIPYIIPKLESTKKPVDDILDNPLNYLQNMIYINLYLENKELKSFQFFPLKTSMNNYYKINSSALIDIFESSGKASLLASISNIKGQMWNKYFNFSKIKLKGYSFNHEIQTDGYAVSINFILNEDIERKAFACVQKTNARNETFKNNKILDEEEQLKIKQQKAEAKKLKLKNERDKKKLFRQEKKDEFKKLSVEEKEKIKLELNLKKEFPYVDDLVKDNVMRKYLEDKVKNNLLVVNDPGQGDILYMAMPTKEKTSATMTIKQIDVDIKDNISKDETFKNATTIDNITFFKYTNKRRVKELKRLKYGRLIENKKKKIKVGGKTMKEIEVRLTNFNSKSCTYKVFMEYVKEKMIVNRELKSSYDNTYFRKLNWFSYINKRRHEDNLLNEIEEKFGSRDDLVIVFGDWSGNGTSNHMSTPNKHIIKKLAERFKIIMIDEFKTTKLHYKHNQKCDNLPVPMTISTEFKTIIYQNKNQKKVIKKIKRIKKKKTPEKELYKREKRTTKCIHSILRYKSVRSLLLCNLEEIAW